MKSIATQTELRKRLISSLAAGAIFIAAVVTGFFSVQSAGRSGGLPAPLRRGLETNGKIAQAVFSESRTSVELPVPSGKPRVNGLLGLKTPVDLANYQIVIESGVKILKVPLAEFEKLPYAKVSTLFKCIEGWSMPVEYEGYRFSDFMEQFDVGRKEDGSYYKYVGLVTPDEKYYVSIDIESMMHPQSLLAVKMNEMPLALENGAPLRLIIPIKYGIKSLKRIGKIYFSDQRPADYWAERGYDWYSGL